MTIPATGRFPSDFLFGVATAAYQIEGAAHEDGRRDSIWDTFARLPGAILEGATGDVACDHYHRYREDVALMGDLGVNAYRFSTSWARACPDGSTPNPRGIDFYERLVDELLHRGITPWVTLYHWDLPQALQDRGGWTSRDTVDAFTAYALTLHDALGDRVAHWTTLNEPQCSAFVGHIAGQHAPGHTSVSEGLLAAHHLLLAHGRTVRALRDRDDTLRLGITLNLTVADPVNPDSTADLDAARRFEGQFNRWFLDPVFRRRYPSDIWNDIAAAAPTAIDELTAAIHNTDLEEIAAPLDVLGVNYYQGAFVSSRPASSPPPSGDAPTTRPTASAWPAGDGIHLHDRGLPRTGMNWEVNPSLLTRLLSDLHTNYTAATGIRLVVTENGAAYPDTLTRDHGNVRVHDHDRARFLREHVDATAAAIAAGVDVAGYFAWTLLDNFEWAWGYTQRFGLIHVDHDTQQRTFKHSARVYRGIVTDERGRATWNTGEAAAKQP